MRRILALFLLAAVAVAVAGCGRRSRAEPGASDAVAAVYPLAFVLDRVAGEDVVVTDLTPAGVEPHDVELTPKQVVALAEARLTVLIGGGFQPSVEDALASTDGTTLDVLDPLAPDLIEGDPHIWLDPRLLASAGDAVAESLADVGLGSFDELTDNAAELRAELEELDQSYSSTLQDCERRELVTAHDAFAYLARRYELEPIAIAGMDPAAEPSAARLGEIARLARDRGVTTIFTESLVSPRVAETVALEAGVETAVLDPIETQPADGDYFTAMERNLDALSEALGCRP